MKKKNEFRLNGNTLRTLRTIYGIKQIDLADMLAINSSQITRAETGHRKLTREQTLLFLNEIDVSEETAIQIDNILRQISDRKEYEAIRKRLGK